MKDTVYHVSLYLKMLLNFLFTPIDTNDQSSTDIDVLAVLQKLSLGQNNIDGGFCKYFGGFCKYFGGIYKHFGGFCQPHRTFMKATLYTEKISSFSLLNTQQNNLICGAFQ